MSGPVWLVGAWRSAVSPRGSAFKAISAPELAASVLRRLLEDLSLDARAVDQVILGNALYGGGNPARLAALAAGLPQTAGAITVDSQCCAGIDSLRLAAAMIGAGDGDIIIAGGLESYSTSPRRFTRKPDGEIGKEYLRPPFSPWPDRDPDLIVAAADLAQQAGIDRAEQEAFAIESHQKAWNARARMTGEMVTVQGVDLDPFTRRLTPSLCRRLPIMTGEAAYGLTAATIAVEADAAAMVLLASERGLAKLSLPKTKSLRVAHAKTSGSDPATPALAPIHASQLVMNELGLRVALIGICEIMEAFASQAIFYINETGLDRSRVNLGGGALARGHPIGASGTINVVRLYQEMIHNADARYGLAAIAGAGGLGSAIVLAR